MRVVAVNGSPKMDKGNTALILGPFLEGLKEGGAEVELFYTKRLHVEPCQGEFNCWLKTPGECFQNDDMGMLRGRFAQADVWVLATPLYVDGMAAPLKNVIDRLVPNGMPFIELRDDHCRHALREGVRTGKVVLVSNCGLWERDNFDPLVAHVEAICRNLSREFVGALLRPHGGAVGAMIKMGHPPDDVLEAAREAGRQLATSGRIERETLRTVARDLISREAYIDVVNDHFREALT